MENSLKQAIGRKIRHFRKSKGLTQETLGEKAGISYKFIGEIERGEVNPSIDSLASIAEALGLSVRDLLPEEKEEAFQLSREDVETVKKALKILNRTFSKM